MNFKKSIVTFSQFAGWLYFVDQRIVNRYIGRKRGLVDAFTTDLENVFFCLIILYLNFVAVFIFAIILLFFSVPLDVGFRLTLLSLPIVYIIFFIAAVIYAVSDPDRFAKLIPSCLPGSTQISTPTGSRSLEDIKVGDVIWAWNALETRRVHSVVQKKKKRARQKLLALQLSDRIIFSGFHHSFLTNMGWLTASELKAGNSLYEIDQNGVAVEVVLLSISKSDKIDFLYTLVTSGENTHICGNIVAHNFSFLRIARSLLSKEPGLH